MDRQELLGAFEFLTSRGFVLVDLSGTLEWEGTSLRFDGPGIRIHLSHNDRDGFDCGLVLSGDPGPSVSVAVLLGALSRDEDASARSSGKDLEEQSQFVRAHLAILVALPSQVLNDCRALRFYHVAPWRTEWGRAIQMDADEILAEAQRLERLRDYFSSASVQ